MNQVCISTYQYVPCLCQYILSRDCMNQVCIRFMSVHTLQGLYKLNLYQYKLVCTRFGSVHKVPVKVPVTSTGTLCTDGRVSGTLPLFSGNGMNKYVLSSDYDNTVPFSYIPCYSMVPL